MVISSNDGHPGRGAGRVHRVGNAVARSVDPDVPLEQWLAVVPAVARVHRPAHRASGRRTPGDDLVCRLIEATEDGRLASENELLVNTGVMLIAGFETTTNLISNAVFTGSCSIRTSSRSSRSDPVAGSAPPSRRCCASTPRRSSSAPARSSPTPRSAAPSCTRATRSCPLLAAANRDPDEFDAARDPRPRAAP